MVYTRDIRIKVTALQYEIIKNKAELSTEKTVAGYIRRILTKKDDYAVEKLIQDIHTMVIQEKRIKPNGGTKDGTNPRSPRQSAEAEAAREAPEGKPGTRSNLE